MSLDYNTAKKNNDSSEKSIGFFSDLFATLTFIFLFLYVVASMQASGVGEAAVLNARKVEKDYQEKLDEVIQQYEERIQEFEVRAEALRTGNPKSLVAKIDKVVSEKLSKVQDSQEREIEQRLQRIREEQNFVTRAKQKMDEMNSLDQLVRDLQMANLSAQEELKKYKNELEKKKEQEITKVSQTKEAEIKKIKQEQVQLVEQMQQQKEDQLQKIVQQKEAELQRIQADLQKAIEVERKQAQEIEKRFQDEHKKVKNLTAAVSEKSTKLSSLTQQQQEMEANIKDLESDLGAIARQKSEAEAALASARASSASKDDEINGLRAKADSLAKAKAQMEGDLEKLGAAREELAKGVADAEAEKASLANKLGDLEKKLGQAKARGDDFKKDVGALEAEKAGLENLLQKLGDDKNRLKDKLAKVSQDFDKAKSDVIARQKLAKDLMDEFARNDIDAEVDSTTGEVTIPFAETYYDFGSAVLKDEMKETLKKVIPVFAKTVFKDRRVYSKISTIQLLGYASPIWKGKLLSIDETSDDAREALRYNMDLSYRRAKSIFEYVFNPQEMDYSHQQEMLRLTRVSSLSYIVSKLEPIPENERKDIPEWLSEGRKICRQYNCREWHKVSIKFEFITQTPSSQTPSPAGGQ